MDRIRIVAIGGGGCTNFADPELDDWIMSLIGRARPKVGYLGTASGNAPDKLAGFHAAYSGRAEIAPELSAQASDSQCAAWLAALDLVYVGGGDTRALLNAWRGAGWDRALGAAAQRGVMFAGVSAGAVCWFEQAFSDSGGAGYRALSGLGLVRGSCCPHFSEEPQRRPAYVEAVQRGSISGGLAIDDGVAVLCDGGGPLRAFAARPATGAVRLERDPSGARAIAAPVELSGR